MFLLLTLDSNRNTNFREFDTMEEAARHSVDSGLNNTERFLDILEVDSSEIQDEKQGKFFEMIASIRSQQSQGHATS